MKLHSVVSGLSATLLCAAAHADIHVPAQYPTIQAAVTAAPAGERIVVAAGVYEEQVTIAFKDLSLVGRPGATIRAPKVMAQTLLPASERRAIVGVFGSNVTIRGFTIDGALRGNSNEFFNGIVYLGSGGTIAHCHVTGVRQEPLALDTQSAPIRVINAVAFGTPTVDVLITGNSVDDCMDGVWLTGDFDHPGLIRVRAIVSNNLISGSGAIDLFNQIGIDFQAGVSGAILHNTVRYFVYTQPDGFAVGIFHDNRPAGADTSRVLIHGNRCIGNQIGIGAISTRETLISGNTVTGGPASFAGIAVSGDRNSIVSNYVGDQQFGIGLIGQEFQVYGLATNTRVIGNWINRAAALPIWEQTGVTGSQIFWNLFTP